MQLRRISANFHRVIELQRFYPLNIKHKVKHDWQNTENTNGEILELNT